MGNGEREHDYRAIFKRLFLLFINFDPAKTRNLRGNA